MDSSLIIELAINGALIGLMYALVALGIVLIYKTSGLANLAQGAIAMTGAYVTWAIASGVGAPIGLAIPFALVLMFGIGMLIERLALDRGSRRGGAEGPAPSWSVSRCRTSPSARARGRLRPRPRRPPASRPRRTRPSARWLRSTPRSGAPSA